MALTGWVDNLSIERIAGWAYDDDTPNVPVTLLITANDTLLARVLADKPRSDLQAAGFGDGRHGFDVHLTGLSPHDRHVIAVRRESDGLDLQRSPTVVEPQSTLQSSLRDHCAALVSATTEETDVDAALIFLTEQVEALLHKRSARRSKRVEREALAQIKWRWTGTSAAQPKPPRPLLPRALVIDELPPRAGHDAGSNALLSHMQSLRRLGFEVVFASSAMEPDHDEVLEKAGVVCCARPWHGSVEEVLLREQHCFDVIYMHRASVAWRYAAMARHYQPKAQLIFSVADLHHVRIARQAKVEERQELLAVARHFQTIEQYSALSANAVITHSTEEAVVLRKLAPQAKVVVVPWMVPLQPTGVPLAERHGIAFIGHFAHMPNLDAAYRIIDEIMPMLRLTHPDMECALVGSNMPERLQQPLPGIVPRGGVARLGDVFDSVRLTVAPLSFGAGVKGKVLDSMAAGVPCVCTSIAVEGIELPDILRQLVADDNVGIVRSVMRLHDDAVFNQKCRDAGLTYIAAHCSEERTDNGMRDAVGLPPSGITQI